MILLLQAFSQFLGAFNSQYHTKCKLLRIILLGDVDQLPSIDPGDVYRNLHDYFRAQDHGDFAKVVGLVTSHRANSELLFQNAQSILDGSQLSLPR